jgi:hypothetical protein
LAVKSFEVTNQGPILQFHTFSGQQYAVEFSSVPASNHWTILPGSSVSGDGCDKTVTDTNTAGVPYRFYRIRQD